MAKRKVNSSAKYEANFHRTAANLARKGKTNKKLKLNMNAQKYESSKNIEIREMAKAKQGVKTKVA